jgi:uncharacterized secreted protein with C-terminal beta-propeller domain
MGRLAGLQRWVRSAAAVGMLGALSALPVLAGCAGVETAAAADATLERFTSCAALTGYARNHALEEVGPYGLGGGMVALASRSASGTVAMDALPAAAPEAKTPGVDFSATNVQEAGVDEPDIVKTDGSRIFALAKNRLYAIDVSGPTPRIAGSLAMPKDALARDMLIAGNRLLVMGDGPVAVRPMPAPTGAPTAKIAPGTVAPLILQAPGGSVLVEIDVTDIAAMRVVETMETEARYVNARLTGSTARVVVAAGAPTGIAFTSPAGPGEGAERTAAAANRNAVAHTTADDWLPRYSVTSATGRAAARPVVACDAVSRPAAYSGLGTLTVLTIDLTRGLEPIDSDAIMASSENVYASTDALYVATNRWASPGEDGSTDAFDTTQIHKFDTRSTSQTSYRGSGTVTGHLLNQFSMSEFEGRLRVATTQSGFGLVGGDAVVGDGRASESYVTVLADADGRLRQFGQVGGLGKGERIYAVRFVGDTGYVVTFRQTDPLYTVDLSDPGAPRVAGELKIAGYSAYLHPIGDDLLIGVGQDADGGGRATGLQVSLFDVSDPASPKRLQRAVLPGATSEAEWDHHAFLWWPASSLAVIPYQRYDLVAVDAVPGTALPGVPAGPESGALGMRVARDGIAELGRLMHPVDPQYGNMVRRSLVVGDALYTLSDGGIMASGLGDLRERTWLAFG